MIISFIYFGRACGVRVDGASPRRFLRFLSLTALWAEGGGGGFAADYKVSVTGFTFSVIRHDKHSANWLAALASPYPASPDFLHGKACHTILRSLCSLTARLSPTHNILRVTAFLQNMFAGVTRVPLPPLCRGQNKTPRSLASSAQRLAKNKVPPPGGRWWRQPPKGVHFLARQGDCMVSLRAKPGCTVFPPHRLFLEMIPTVSCFYSISPSRSHL